MSTISVTGSGLDIPSLVSQLVQASRQPTESRLKTQASQINTKLSAVGQIKSSLSSLQTALEKLAAVAHKPSFQARAQEGAGFTATASSDAVPGSYSVEVLALATAQKLASAAYEPGKVVGSGTLSIAWGSDDDQSLTVEFEEGATLADIARAVNRAAGGKGVTAAVITADDGEHLVFTARGTGLANALTITASGGDGGLAAVTNGAGGGLVEQVAAADARVRVDGFERTSASNEIADLVPGVTLALATARPGEAFRLEVEADRTELESAIEAFVSAYNGAGSVLRTTTRYDSATRTAAALTGDSLVRGLQQQLRNLASGHTLELKALGLTLDKAGVMSFDKGKLGEALAADPQAVSRLFGEEGAIASPLRTVLKTYLDSEGVLARRTENLDKQKEGLDKQLEQLDLRMEKLAALYTAQFTAMETMILQLQSSASSLNGLLAQGSRS